MTLINQKVRPYIGLICGILLFAGWGLDRNSMNDRVYQLEVEQNGMCSKMRQIQDTLTSHSLTDNERTEKIETLVSQCLMDDNEPTRRMKN